MMRWIDKATGKTASRIEIVKAFERTTGRVLSADEFQQCLDMLAQEEAGR